MDPNQGEQATPVVSPQLVSQTPTEQPMYNKRNWKKWLIMCLILIVFLAGGAYFYSVKLKQSFLNQKVVEPNSVTSVSVPNSQISSSPAMSVVTNNQHFLIIQQQDKVHYDVISQKGTFIIELTLPSTLGRGGSLKVSPDDKYLTYNSWEAKDSPGCMLQAPPNCPPPTYGIRLIDLNTKAETLIYGPSPESSSYTFWSPDSKYIAFSSTSGTYLYDINLKSSIRIAPESGDNISWAPDNSGLYLSDGDNITFYNLSTKNLQNVTAGLAGYMTPDNKYLIVKKNDGIYSQNLKTNEWEKITTLNFGGVLNNDILVYSQLIQAHPGSQNPQPDDKYIIYTYDLNTKQEKKVLTGISVNYLIHPDGTKLVYTDFLGPEKGKLFNLDVDSGTKTAWEPSTEQDQIFGSQ